MSDSLHTDGSPRTLSIGGATFDLFLTTDQSLIHTCEGTSAFALPLGSKIRLRDVITTCGGGANNTAVGLARLGCNAAFSGILADDAWGEILLKNLHTEHVDTRFTTVIERETSSFSLILTAQSGERSILYDPGTNRHLHDVTFDRDAVHTMDAIYLNHIHADSCAIEDDLIDILTQNRSLHFTWNPGGTQIEAGMDTPHSSALIARATLLLLNKEEALAFTKNTSVRQALRTLAGAGARMICITDGKNGCTATDGNSLFHCPVLPCTVVDTTGAGDAFGCAATWALLTGKDLPTAMKAGTMNAMCVVGAIGAQSGLLTETQIVSKLQDTVLPVAVEPL